MVVLGASDRPHHIGIGHCPGGGGAQARLQTADARWRHPVTHPPPPGCTPGPASHLPAQMSAVGRAPRAATAANSDPAPGPGRRRDCSWGAQHADVRGFCPAAWRRAAWGP